jgi:hypothetical protein
MSISVSQCFNSCFHFKLKVIERGDIFIQDSDELRNENEPRNSLTSPASDPHHVSSNNLLISSTAVLLEVERSEVRFSLMELH